MPEGETVQLTFTSFDLVPEACGDFVQVYDYNQASPQLAGKHGTNYKQNPQFFFTYQNVFTHQ